MSSTFKSWLIANIALAISCILVIVLGLIIIFAGDFNNTTKLMTTGMLALFPVLADGSPPLVWERCLLYVAMAGAVGFITYSHHQYDGSDYAVMVYTLGTSLIVASAIGGMVAKYANKNFREVVSRRILYHNSNVSLYQAKIDYTIDRFCICSLSIMMLIVTPVIYFTL